MSDPDTPKQPIDVHTVVRQHYSEAAASFHPKKSSCCCGSGGCLDEAASKLYPASELDFLPADVTGLSMGCGDPITLAALRPGQTVLDLGSGGGIDCFMAAKKVGETGHVIGVDMTAEMLEKARSNLVKMGYKNVEFRLGEIEHLPVADNTVDTIISNCVVNLSPDKPQVFREAYRVLKSGGKLALSDIVTDGPLPKEIKDSLTAWAGCVAGALDVNEYIADLKAAGFSKIDITPVYFDQQTVDEFVKQSADSSCCGENQKLVISDGVKSEVIELEEPIELNGKPIREAVFSAKITAYKP
jgi:arsenite methyltransferase